MTTATATCIFMPQNADRLTLMQYLSPAFPVGSYAYSQGLEQAITDGQVTDPASLSAWITAVLTHGSARMDAILLAHGRSTPADLADLADLALAYASSHERQTEMREQGAAFGQVIATVTGQSPPVLPYALALAYATRPLSLPTAEVLALYLHAIAAQLVSVAVRFVPLKAADGQKLLSDLAPLITRLAETCATQPLTALSSATLGADLAQMRHETLDVRIYRS
jgi:urease accessory protein